MVYPCHWYGTLVSWYTCVIDMVHLCHEYGTTVSVMWYTCVINTIHCVIDMGHLSLDCPTHFCMWLTSVKCEMALTTWNHQMQTLLFLLSAACACWETPRIWTPTNRARCGDGVSCSCCTCCGPLSMTDTHSELKLCFDCRLCHAHCVLSWYSIRGWQLS